MRLKIFAVLFMFQQTASHLCGGENGGVGAPNAEAKTDNGRFVLVALLPERISGQECHFGKGDITTLEKQAFESGLRLIIADSMPAARKKFARDKAEIEILVSCSAFADSKPKPLGPGEHRLQGSIEYAVPKLIRVKPTVGSREYSSATPLVKGLLFMGEKVLKLPPGYQDEPAESNVYLLNESLWSAFVNPLFDVEVKPEIGNKLSVSIINKLPWGVDKAKIVSTANVPLSLDLEVEVPANGKGTISIERPAGFLDGTVVRIADFRIKGDLGKPQNNKEAKSGAIPQSGTAPSTISDDKIREALPLLGTAAMLITPRFAAGGKPIRNTDEVDRKYSTDIRTKPTSAWLCDYARDFGQVGGEHFDVVLKRPIALKLLKERLGKEEATEKASVNVDASDKARNIEWFKYNWLFLGVDNENVIVVRALCPKEVGISPASQPAVENGNNASEKQHAQQNAQNVLIRQLELDLQKAKTENDAVAARNILQKLEGAKKAADDTEVKGLLQRIAKQATLENHDEIVDAIKALGAMGERAKPAVSELIKLTTSPGIVGVTTITRGAGVYGGDGNYSGRVSSWRESFIPKKACSALGKIGDDRAVSQLTAIANSSPDQLLPRMAAREALIQLQAVKKATEAVSRQKAIVAVLVKSAEGAPKPELNVRLDSAKAKLAEFELELAIARGEPPPQKAQPRPATTPAQKAAGEDAKKKAAEEVANQKALIKTLEQSLKQAQKINAPQDDVTNMESRLAAAQAELKRLETESATAKALADAAAAIDRAKDAFERAKEAVAKQKMLIRQLEDGLQQARAQQRAIWQESESRRLIMTKADAARLTQLATAANEDVNGKTASLKEAKAALPFLEGKLADAQKEFAAKEAAKASAPKP